MLCAFDCIAKPFLDEEDVSEPDVRTSDEEIRASQSKRFCAELVVHIYYLHILEVMKIKLGLDPDSRLTRAQRLGCEGLSLDIFYALGVEDVAVRGVRPPKACKRLGSEEGGRAGAMRVI